MKKISWMFFVCFVLLISFVTIASADDFSGGIGWFGDDEKTEVITVSGDMEFSDAPLASDKQDPPLPDAIKVTNWQVSRTRSLSGSRIVGAENISLEKLRTPMKSGGFRLQKFDVQKSDGQTVQASLVSDVGVWNDVLKKRINATNDIYTFEIVVPDSGYMITFALKNPAHSDYDLFLLDEWGNQYDNLVEGVGGYEMLHFTSLPANTPLLVCVFAYDKNPLDNGDFYIYMGKTWRERTGRARLDPPVTVHMNTNRKVALNYDRRNANIPQYTLTTAMYIDDLTYAATGNAWTPPNFKRVAYNGTYMTGNTVPTVTMPTTEMVNYPQKLLTMNEDCPADGLWGYEGINSSFYNFYWRVKEVGINYIYPVDGSNMEFTIEDEYQ